MICGVQTNIITDAVVADGDSPDCPQLIPMLDSTITMGFRVEELSADKAYNSIDNYNAVSAVDGTAYIPFKSNITGQTKGSRAKLWRRAFHYFQLNQDEFYEHYHLRSNIESANMAVKSKLGDYVRAKTETACINEILLKALCHNIRVLIQETFELGIKPEFLVWG